MVDSTGSPSSPGEWHINCTVESKIKSLNTIVFSDSTCVCRTYTVTFIIVTMLHFHNDKVDKFYYNRQNRFEFPP